jgi:hypothetical protein
VQLGRSLILSQEIGQNFHALSVLQGRTGQVALALAHGSLAPKQSVGAVSEGCTQMDPTAWHHLLWPPCP